MPPQCWTRDWNPASLCTSSASRSRSSLLRDVVDQIEPRQPTSAPPLAGSTPGEPLCGAIGWIEIDQHIRNALHGIEVPNLGAYKEDVWVERERLREREDSPDPPTCRPRTRRGWAVLRSRWGKSVLSCAMPYGSAREACPPPADAGTRRSSPATEAGGSLPRWLPALCSCPAAVGDGCPAVRERQRRGRDRSRA